MDYLSGTIAVTDFYDSTGIIGVMQSLQSSENWKEMVNKDINQLNLYKIVKMWEKIFWWHA